MKLRTLVMLGAVAFGAYKAYKEMRVSGGLQRNSVSTVGGV
ncbi:MAG TPA: hypothetical protein VM370_00355 [Candidatus Thermoplasmatota archaeon]|nr:hypothetical protein [Candidatus Thermoplasmatota archaeon]